MGSLLGSTLLLVPVIAALVVGAAGLVASRSADPGHAVRGRLRLSLAVFGLVLLAAWAWATAQPSLLGLPLVVGPGAAATAGVLGFALPPTRPRGDRAVRVATLLPRSAAQVMTGEERLVAGILLIALVGVLVTTGVTADGSGATAGRGFSAASATTSASASPYPGWFYGAPILVTATLLVGAVAFAIRRTVLLPAMTTDERTDAAWRAAVGRTLGSIAAAGLLLYLAGVLWAAGAAWSVLEQTGTTGLAPIAVAQSVVSQLAAVAAVVLLVAAAIRVSSVGRAVTGKPVAA